METIGQSRLQSFLSTGWLDSKVTNTHIRGDSGHEVKSFPRLVERVAHLSFYNRDQVLLFRGQGEDFRNQSGNTSIHPTIFRGRSAETAESWEIILRGRYQKLKDAEQLLFEYWDRGKLPDLDRIERQQSLRWAILQHYKICETPLLDVTQSLRVAASFALANASDDEAVVYVLGVPQISGAITASAEAELQILRLSSMCPPSATRPHFQEGYLLGHYPDIQSADEKQKYRLYEVDFAKRLLCKFRLIGLDNFWRKGFPPVPPAALYPDKRDVLVPIAKSIRARLPQEN